VAFIKTDEINKSIEENKMTEERKDQEGLSESSRKLLLKITREAMTDAVNGRPLSEERSTTRNYRDIKGLL